MNAPPVGWPFQSVRPQGPSSRGSRPERRRAQVEAVPVEVQVARAFVAMTGVDPTSIFCHQSPPVRQRPASYGPAHEETPAPKRSLWSRARGRVRRVASWLYHRTVRFCLS